MEVIEKSAEGLERNFNVKVPAAELNEKLTAKLTEIKGQVHLKGFRKGKAPVSYLKKLYGKGVMSEIVQEIVTESTQKAFEEREIQPASTPQPKFHSDMEKVMNGEADLDYDVEAEILPTFEPCDVAELSLTKPVCDVPQEDIDEALQRIADQQTSYAARDEGAKAEEKDQVNIDFLGKIDDEPFDGGKGEGFDLVLGSGQFIPGFEDQLIGVKAGDELDVKVTFPEEYHAADLKGKDAVFEVKVHEVRAPETVAIDEALAEKVGLESLEDLTNRVAERLKSDFTQASRAHVKRALLDKLDAAHDFELPKGMVNAEFQQIWAQVQSSELDDEDKDKSEDELKEEYSKIAERRVRLGLVLAEIGKRAEVTVPNEDLQMELYNMARAYPGQEKEVLEFYQSNPQAMQQLRAPLFEEKVVDYILERADVTEETVSKEKLMEDPEGDDAA